MAELLLFLCINGGGHGGGGGPLAGLAFPFRNEDGHGGEGMFDGDFEVLGDT